MCKVACQSPGIYNEVNECTELDRSELFQVMVYVAGTQEVIISTNATYGLTFILPLTFKNAWFIGWCPDSLFILNVMLETYVWCSWCNVLMLNIKQTCTSECLVYKFSGMASDKPWLSGQMIKMLMKWAVFFLVKVWEMGIWPPRQHKWDPGEGGASMVPTPPLDKL